MFLPPVVAAPCADPSVRLHVDASDEGAGAVPFQTCDVYFDCPDDFALKRKGEPLFNMTRIQRYF